MEISILAFGIAKEIMGGSKVSVPLGDEATVEALMGALSKQYPALNKLTSFMVAVNGEYVKSGIIKPGDEVAIIPPVSGG
jgi:molybdopterin synthase sulfur carrier subunit